MNIFVCVKHVPDSAANITIDPDGCRIREKIAFLLNPYDEYALTEAVKLKARFPETVITAICLGKTDAKNTIRSAMAMGADQGLLIETDTRPDSILTARAIKAAMDRMDGPDLIFTGKESIDTEGMQTMFRLGALLDLPVANNVVALTLVEGNMVADVDYSGGTSRRYQLSLPCVIGTGRGPELPRYPTFKDVMLSKKKPIEVITLEELAVEPPQSRVTCTRLEPLTLERDAVPIEGTLTDMAHQIVDILTNEAKVL